ncbi:MAG: PQQ-dependent sugar dehydrogenase, partial [Flavobacteriales bacterium]|nr:PQQ-dependent sugar dehydrogenase [Flavobacteriales bacterium]
MTLRSIPLAVAALFTACAGAQTPSPVKVQLQQYVTGLPNITDITHAGDDRLFVVQRNGTVRIIDGDGQLLPGAFLTINVNSGSNEQGLLGLAFDPDYADNGHFFVYYTAGSSAGFSRVARYTVSEGDPNAADPASAVELFTVTQPFTNHNGGDLAFGPDGHLYVSLGDGGSGGDPQDHGQRMSSRLGKILRIDVGELPWTVPPDNPFVGATGDTLPEIWASGLRNPWRMGFDRETGDLWIGDVGQNTWEEIDFWPAGDHSGPNFGWRCYEGFATFNSNDCQPAANYVQPVKTHPTNQWCSVIGGRVYRGEQFYRLSGLYIYTDHCYGRVFALQPDEDGGWTGMQLTTSSVSSPSVIAENVHGELFLGTHGNNGRVYRILDVCPMPQPVITVEGNVLTSSPADGYTWFLDGEPIPDGTEQTLE